MKSESIYCFWVCGSVVRKMFGRNLLDDFDSVAVSHSLFCIFLQLRFFVVQHSLRLWAHRVIHIFNHLNIFASFEVAITDIYLKYAVRRYPRSNGLAGIIQKRHICAFFIFTTLLDFFSRFCIRPKELSVRETFCLRVCVLYYIFISYVPIYKDFTVQGPRYFDDYSRFFHNMSKKYFTCGSKLLIKT